MSNTEHNDNIQPEGVVNAQNQESSDSNRSEASISVNNSAKDHDLAQNGNAAIADTLNTQTINKVSDTSGLSATQAEIQVQKIDSIDGGSFAEHATEDVPNSNNLTFPSNLKRNVSRLSNGKESDSLFTSYASEDEGLDDESETFSNEMGEEKIYYENAKRFVKGIISKSSTSSAQNNVSSDDSDKISG
ncbi:MAG: hypothetical protein SFT93_00580 [Rickettsiaceae bacterium]|nr:hypothetical protein [Rickettsiaceae bacterium]